MRAVFTYQVLRLLRDKVLLVWTLGLPIVLSLMFMAMFSGLEKAYETTPMSFGVVRDEAYRSAPGLDALVERVSAADADPRLIAEVAHSTASEAEAAEAHERTERPRIAQGLPLQAYSDDQLDDLMAWIRSDGVGRSEAGEVEELRSALALRRRGSGIDAVLANAVRRTR